MKTKEEINIMACKYASNFPSQYEERKNAFIAAMTGEKIPDVQTVTSANIEVKPTDEEIEAWVLETHVFSKDERRAAIEGAKAVRDNKIPTKD